MQMVLDKITLDEKRQHLLSLEQYIMTSMSPFCKHVTFDLLLGWSQLTVVDTLICGTMPGNITYSQTHVQCSLSLHLCPQVNSLTQTVLVFVPGCHLYSINTHHASELRIVAAIRNKLLLITRKHPRFEGFSAVASGAESPVEEFQYIRVQTTPREFILERWIGNRNADSLLKLIYH